MSKIIKYYKIHINNKLLNHITVDIYLLPAHMVFLENYVIITIVEQILNV